MHLGLPVSLLLHAALLSWALVSFKATPPLKIPEVEPVEVAIISPDDLVRLRQGDRSSKKLETRKAKTPQKTKPAKKIVRRIPVRAVEPPKSAPPPKSPPKAAEKKITVKVQEDKIAEKLASLQPLPKPGPTPEQLKKKAEAERKAKEAKRKAEAKKTAAAKKKAEAKRRAEKKRKERARKLAEKKRRERERRKRKKQFDPDKLAALLNKIPDKSAPSGAQDSRPDKKLPKGPRAGAPEGKDTRLTASQRSLLGVMMKRAVRECWRVQTGLSGADRLIVDVEVKLDPTGNLRGEPRVMNSTSDPLFADAANNAIRALKQCEPYDLPRDLYKGGWDHMVVRFDPQRMF